MNLRANLPVYLSVLCALSFASAFAGEAGLEPNARREILICTSTTASPAIRAAAADLIKDTSIPLFKALVDTQHAGNPQSAVSEKVLKDSRLAAFNHLIIVGLRSTDPLLEKGWDHYASVNEATQTFYAQGWGYLKGDIGYIESDRNPFLHSSNIGKAPFETVLVKLTGTTEAGVLAAVKEFRNSGLLNGFVPAGKWERPKTTILDLDPALELPSLKLPQEITLKNGPAPLTGWVQVPANEYRAILEDGGVEPLHMWRFKYLKRDAFDRAAAWGWFAGINRMAYGNSIDLIEFKSAGEAKKCAGEICRKGWKKIELNDHPAWQNDLSSDELWDKSKPPAKTTLVVLEKFLLLSTLPTDSIPLPKPLEK